MKNKGSETSRYKRRHNQIGTRYLGDTLKVTNWSELPVFLVPATTCNTEDHRKGRVDVKKVILVAILAVSICLMAGNICAEIALQELKPSNRFKVSASDKTEIGFINEAEGTSLTVKFIMAQNPNRPSALESNPQEYINGFVRGVESQGRYFEANYSSKKIILFSNVLEVHGRYGLNPNDTIPTIVVFFEKKGCLYSLVLMGPTDEVVNQNYYVLDDAIAKLAKLIQ